MPLPDLCISLRRGIFLIAIGFSLLFQTESDLLAQNALPDSVTLSSQNLPDSVAATGKGQPAGNTRTSVIDQPDVSLTASDSLIFTFDSTRVGTLFGNAKANHTQGNLEAGQIGLDLTNSIMRAQSAAGADTLNQPVLTREGESVRSESVAFNYKSQRGKFKVARFKYEEANLIGTEVKNKTEHVVFIKDGIYSTCTLDHPHYYIKAGRMKIVDEEEVFFTNAMLYVLDIPYPFVFPFGYLPAKIEQKQSGLLSPTYAFQQQSSRGLGIQNFGWFQYFNDNLTGTFSVDLFTSGTFYSENQLRYAKSGNYNGSIGYGYSLERGLESTDPDFTKRVEQNLSVQHSQKFNPYSQLSARINYFTADFYRQNSYDIEDQAQVSSSSNIGYTFRAPNNSFSLSSDVALSQNFTNNSTTIRGPNFSFNPRSISPFKDDAGGSNGPLSSLNISYSNQFTSQYEFRPLDGDSAQINWFEALFDSDKYEEATGSNLPVNYGFRQTFSMNTRLLPTELINVNASVSGTEYWYPYKVDRFYNEETQKVESRYDYQFASARNFSSNLSANTTFYGIWDQRFGNIRGFRHTVQPRVSLSYSPDFSKDFWGYYRSYERPTSDSTFTTEEYPFYDGNIAGGPGRGESMSLNFSVNNTFETKWATRDTTGEKKEKVVKLIDSYSLSTSYNFAAKQYKLSDLSMNLSSTVVDGLRLSARSSFSFYGKDEEGNRIETYLWDQSGKLMRMTNLNLSMSTRFSERGAQSPRPPVYYPQRYNPLNQQLFSPLDPNYRSGTIPDFSVPWSVSFSFTYNWRKTGNRLVRSAVLNANNISLNLTREWNFSTQIGYDFIEQELTPSAFSLTRQLHCWNLSFNWNPFGTRSYYFFKLTVNSAQFQSIFQKLPGLNNLEQSSDRRRSSSSSSGGFFGGF
jgi:hypothetical protein